MRYIPFIMVLVLAGCNSTQFITQKSITQQVREKTPEEFQKYLEDQEDNSLCFFDQFGEIFARPEMYEMVYAEMVKRNISPYACQPDGTVKMGK